ncbi:putative ankyrin repeat protein RF_0381 [Cloeon dipterum]|uniref:putative ankyrin repeat protein RF_0381 n=1 Tax=Cloeon dipterum TaxID=197152 RepID=UPI00321F91DC
MTKNIEFCINHAPNLPPLQNPQMNSIKKKEEGTINLLKFDELDVINHPVLYAEDSNPKTRLGLNDVMLAAYLSKPEVNFVMLQRDRNFRFKTEYGLSVMHFAALNKRCGVELVSIYSVYGLDPIERDCDGATPIDYALLFGYYQTAEMLLLFTNSEINLLHYCVMRNQLELAEQVARKKPELLTKRIPDGRHALHLAALSSDWAMCDWIAEMMQSLDPSLVDSECQERGCTAFHYAGLNKTRGVELADLFADWNMDVNKRSLKGYTPVHFALISENLETAKEMIRLGADYNAKIFEKNPMKVLLEWERFESVKFLHSCDNDLIHHARVKGLHPIHFAARYADLDFVQWLVEVAGINVHRLSLKQMSSPLHYAGSNLRHGAEIAKYLIDSGVDVDRKNQIGETPLHCALRHKKDDVAKLLIGQGADLSVKLNGENYLHFCLRNGAEICAKLVYDCRKGLINDVLSDGRTVLHIAAEKASVQTAFWLYEAGASIHAQTNDGKKPAFFAKDETMRLYFRELLKQQELLETLQSLPADENLENRADTNELHAKIELLKIFD